MKKQDKRNYENRKFINNENKEKETNENKVTIHTYNMSDIIF